MGLFSSLLGKTKPIQSNLDNLFALPSASITLQSAAGMSCSGHAGVCFKPTVGQDFAATVPGVAWPGVGCANAAALAANKRPAASDTP